MDNRLVDATWTYHNGTKHSPESVRTNAHFLDWPNQPLLFKVYSTLEPLPLPGDLAPPAMPVLVAILPAGADPLGPDVPDLRTLAGILFFSAGITRRRAVHGGEILFRAAACTGALYHIELYLVCGDLPDLEAVGERRAADDLADGVREGGDVAQGLGDGGDARGVEAEAVLEALRHPALATAREVALVGADDVVGGGVERVGEGAQGGVLLRAGEQGEAA